MLYRWLRPLLFRMPPERAHRLIFAVTHWLQKMPIDGVCRWLGGIYPQLQQEVWGIEYPTPLGLAAGLDKDGTHLRLWQQLGFGAIEIGSVTAQASVGNPQPRLFRLPEDGALLNRMGLNNRGPDVVGRHVAQVRHQLRIPLGINLAKTHDPGILGEAALDDFVQSYTRLAPLASTITLNISCPNTAEGKTFEEPSSLASLLGAIGVVASKMSKPPPCLVKLSPPPSADWEPGQALGALLAVLREYAVDGLVIANTAAPSSISTLHMPAGEIAAMGRGGLSGRPLHNGAIKLLEAVYAQTEGQLPLVGVGGIDSAESAYAMIKAGASLVQMYTGLIYQGPGVIRRIHRGLVRLLEADGYAHIREAVGASVRA